MVGELGTDGDRVASAGSIDPEAGGVGLCDPDRNAGLSMFIGVGDLPEGDATGDTGVC